MTTQFGVRSSLRSAAARRIEAAGRAFERSQVSGSQASGAGEQVPGRVSGVGDQVSESAAASSGVASPGTRSPDTRRPIPETPITDTWHLTPDRRPASGVPETGTLEAEVGNSRLPGQCRAIIEVVAAKYELRALDILCDRRAKVLIGPRHEAMYRCVAETPLSLPAIGRVFHRDHTSIGHGVMRHHLRTCDPLPRGMDWQAGRKSAVADFRTQGTDPGNTRDRRKRR